MTDKDRVEVLNQELILEAPDGKLGGLIYTIIKLREQIRARHKAIMDYGNDIATAKDEDRE